MNKQKLVELINDYVNYKEEVLRTYYEQKINPSAEDKWLDLVVEGDDRWQTLINFIYKDNEDD